MGRNDTVQRGLAVLNPSLAIALGRFTSKPLDAKLRKSEAALVSHHARAVTRVSPFSLITGVHVAFLEPQGTEKTVQGYVRVESQADVSRLLYRRLFRKLSGFTEFYNDLKWEITPSLRVDEESITFWRRQWGLESAQTRIDGASEQIVSIRKTHAWVELVERMRRRGNGPFSAPELRSVLNPMEPATDETYALFAHLVSLGLIYPYMHIAEQEDDFLERWSEWLSDLGDRLPDGILDAHKKTRDVLGQFAQMDAAERIAGLSALNDQWAHVFRSDTTIPRSANLLYEDGILSQGYAIAREKLEEWTRSLSGLTRLLLCLDEQNIVALAIEEIFVDSFGEGGVCSDIRGFARVVGERLPALISGELPEGMRSEKLGRAFLDRQKAEEAIKSWFNSNQVELDIEHEINSWTDHRFSSSRVESIAIFGQPSEDNFVLNHVYGGAGRFVSRFLRKSSERAHRVISSYVKDLYRGEKVVQLRSTLGFNANLAPLITEMELSIEGEASAGLAIAVDEMELVHEQSGLRLRHRVSGEALVIAYLGFLTPITLPVIEMLLTAYRGTPQVGFRAFTAAVRQKFQEGGGGIVSTPRLRYGSIVVQRQKWAVRSQEFLSSCTDSGIVGAALWRKKNRIPRLVYVSPLRSAAIRPLEKVFAPKPIFVDLLSRLHLEHLAKRIAKFGDLLQLEEFLPVPSGEGLCDKHAQELVFEINAPTFRRLDKVIP